MPRGNAVNGSSFVWPCTMWRLGDDTAHGRPRPRTLQATNDEGRCRLLAWRRVTGGRGSPRDLGHGGPQPRTRQNPRSERCDGALDGAAIALTRPAVASIPPRPPPERCEDRFIPQSCDRGRAMVVDINQRHSCYMEDNSATGSRVGGNRPGRRPVRRRMVGDQAGAGHRGPRPRTLQTHMFGGHHRGNRR